MTTACSECSEIDPYCKNPNIEIIFEEVTYETTMKEGVIWPDMIDNMHFWGTLKIKKFQNMSIKMYEGEVYTTNV